MGFFHKILRFCKWVVVFFFSSTILAVVLYRFVPVFATPLMVIRSVEQLVKGDDIKWHHSWTSLEHMSPHLPVAVMAGEDQNFLKHHGFDVEAIKKAMEYNETHEKKRGASTISQQTAKNVFLWPGRSWLRKGLEAYFTFLIELLWSKQRIMEVYLNSIEMGPGIYGAEAVAEHHFNKSAAVLTRHDCALIAATLPKPLEYSSKTPSAYMQKRQRQILRQMKNMPRFPAEGEDVK